MDGASKVIISSQSEVDTCSGNNGLTQCNYVATNSIAKGEIAGNGDEDIDERRNAYTGKDHGRGAIVRIVADFVQYRKHLSTVSD